MNKSLKVLNFFGRHYIWMATKPKSSCILKRIRPNVNPENIYQEEELANLLVNLKLLCRFELLLDFNIFLLELSKK